MILAQAVLPNKQENLFGLRGFRRQDLEAVIVTDPERIPLTQVSFRICPVYRRMKLSDPFQKTLLMKRLYNESIRSML